MPQSLELHRRILHRLLAAWVAISLVLGLAVFYLGMKNIDDQLVELASEELGKVSSASVPLLNRPGNNHGALDRVAAEFLQQHFIVAEIYDRDRKRVANAVNPRHTDLNQELNREHVAFPTDGGRHYEKRSIGDQTVLAVMLPLKDAEGAIAGYFEGVFLIDRETLDRLRRELTITLAVVLCAVLLTTVSLYPVILSLNRDVMRYSRDLLKGNVELMEVLGSAVAKRDSDTNAHNYRVTIYAVKLAEAAGLDAAAIRDLIAGAFLHDVGKIGIPDGILQKPGSLDEGEWSTMRGHVALGVEILKKSAWLQRARDVVAYHHEKFDGSGYLRGLKGTAIPLNARIFAIVDIFDALTSKRPYKEAIPFDQAMAILRGYAGHHLDPELVALFDGIVEPLYRQVSGAGDEAVEAQLWAMIERSFFSAGSQAAGD